MICAVFCSACCWQERSRMDGEMFGSGHWGGSFPYASIPKESQFVFDAKASPLQLQLFGSAAGEMNMLMRALITVLHLLGALW